MELAVPGDAQNDDHVGQNDGGGQRDGDGVDELLLGEKGAGIVAVHSRSGVRTLSGWPGVSPEEEQ